MDRSRAARLLRGGVVALLLFPACGANVPGPIQPPSGTSSITGAVVDVGETVSMSVADLGHWPGGSAIEFREIQPGARPEGLEILGFRVVQTRDQGGVGSVKGFPPQGFVTLPFRGYRWGPGTGLVQVVVGLRLAKPGDFFIPGFVLTYTQDGQAYGVPFHQGVALCTPQPNQDGCSA